MDKLYLLLYNKKMICLKENFSIFIFYELRATVIDSSCEKETKNMAFSKAH